ncbi:MAG TPA: prolyl oligopeptidase family serine peptidase, partial [Candidatus Binatia bacterium]|nr:prolyl oligopeptidase family serine peptidase [Candidatus Binatia bacterium]
MRRIVLFLVVLSLASPAFGQAKHPFTFEDMMKLKRVGDPQVSPDGKWVIFSVVDVDLAANTKTPHVWIVPLNQTQGPSTAAKDSQANPSSSLGMTKERELISDQDADRPRWSPDGKRFAFISNKEQGSQIWIADFDGAAGAVTAVHKWTFFGMEAGGEVWSPDGKTMLFTSDVYPECDNSAFVREYNCNLGKRDEAEKSKVKAQIFTHLLYRHWNAYREGKRSHIFAIAAPAPDESWASGTGRLNSYHDLTPGDYESPVFSLGGQDDYAFSPDGKEICYASNHDKNPAASTNNDLWIVPITGGEAKNITADNPASDSSPLYSPDGRYIAYRAQQRPGYESDRFRLMLYDRKTGGKKALAEEFDGWVGSFTWWGSSVIFFVAEEQGGARVYDILLNYSPPYAAKTSLKGYDDDLAVTPDNKFLVFTRMSISAPSEIYKSPIVIARTLPCGEAGGDVCTSQNPNFELTHLNDAALSQAAMSPLEPFWFTGAHVDKVEGFLVKPPNFDASKKYPVKFLIHGGPQGAWGDDWSYRWNAELFAAPTPATPGGYVVIMINFHGSTGYGQKFIDAINGDWGGAPFEDLMKGLDYAEEHYSFIDKNRECALG